MWDQLHLHWYNSDHYPQHMQHVKLDVTRNVIYRKDPALNKITVFKRQVLLQPGKWQWDMTAILLLYRGI